MNDLTERFGQIDIYLFDQLLRGRIAPGDKIFDAGVSGKDRGWGVGLALSRRIIERAHQGRIHLLDNEEGGAIFDIRLPASRV